MVNLLGSVESNRLYNNAAFLALLIGMLPGASHFQLHAQTPTLKFERITVEHGLSCNWINSITQDQQGFLWIGTDDGLNRYDGYQFKIYKYDPSRTGSISNNEVWCVYVDKSGTLWAGTNGGGLCRYERATDAFSCFQHLPDDSTSISSNAVFTVYEDRQNELWVGTHLGGLNKFDRATGKFIRYSREAPMQSSGSLTVYCIYEDSSRNLWLGTRQGFQIFDRRSKRFLAAPWADIARQLSNWGMTESPDGRLWVPGRGGVLQYDRKNTRFNFFTYSAKNPSWLSYLMGDKIWPIGSHQLLIGTHAGMVIFDCQTMESDYYRYEFGNSASLSGDHVITFHQDEAGNFWLGTESEGLNKLILAQNRFHHRLVLSQYPLAAQNWVLRFHPDSTGALWLGTYSGLIKMSNGGQIEKNYGRNSYINTTSDSILANAVASICQGNDNEKELWLGIRDQFNGGIDKFLLENEKFTHFRHDPNNPVSLSQNWVTTLLVDHRGDLWVGTLEAGLNRLNPDQATFTHFKHDVADTSSLSHNYVTSIFEDTLGELWIGTEGGGLSQWQRRNGNFINYQNQAADTNSLSDNRVYAIYEMPGDSAHHLWVGTAAGLNQFDRRARHFRRFTRDHGMRSDFVIGIQSDNHENLWLTTNEGLARFNPRLVRNPMDEIFTLRELGLDRIEPGAFMKNPNGEFFVGGRYGYVRFHPDSIQENRHVPPMVLTNFTVANQGYGLDSSLTVKKNILLTYDQNFFSVEFAALDFMAPAKNQYAYKLEGFNRDWIYSGNRRLADFTNVPPGTYTFYVKGSNNDGVWNEEGASLKITITSPWWRTHWAYAFYVILFTILLYGWRRFELNRVRIRNELRMQKLEAQKLQEVDQLKSRFFANISHEFRTPLTLILGPVERIRAGEFKGNLPDACDMILRNGRRLLRLINQLLDLARLEAGRMSLQARPENIVSFLKGLILSFASAAERKCINLTVSTPDENWIVYFDRDKLEKIVSNLLSNALKFTPENGKISVAVRRDDSRGEKLFAPTHEGVEISVTDTGPGIPADQLDKIFDRFYQVDASHTREHKGTGIGLALTKELVELHHGEILVYSEVGKGATFVVRLPLGKEYLKPEEVVETMSSDQLSVFSEQFSVVGDQFSRFEDQASSIQDRATSDRGQVEAERISRFFGTTSNEQQTEETIILVVEDNRDVRTYIRQYLEPALKVIEAVDGVDGVDKAMEMIPDLIISDVMMPKRDGNELCRILKTDEKTSHIPIILLTAKADRESKVQGLEIGADDYLIKPFDSQELLARVHNLIKLRRQLRERFSREVVLKPSEIAITPMDEVFLNKVKAVVEAHLSDEDFEIEALGYEVGMSRSQIHRKLKALTNQSASQFIRSLRLHRAVELLKQNAGTVAEIAYQVGFGSQAYFTKCFHEQLGCSPKEYVKNNF